MTHARLAYWDNIKGFLIILVVFAHCLFSLQNRPLNNFLVDAIYMFHMPAFVFVLGFFSKSEHSRSFFPIMNLFVAFILLNGFFMLRAFFLLDEGIIPIVITYHSAWYLFALIIWRLSIPFLERVRNILPLMILISLAAGFWADINMQFAAVKIVVFYPYFIAGYLFSRESLEEIQNKKFFPLGLILLIVTIYMGVISYETFNLTDREILPDSYATFNGFFGRMALLVVAGLAILLLMVSSVEKNIPLLTKAGKNSLAIYLFDRPFTLIFSEKFSTNSTEFQISAAIVVTFLMTLIFGSDKFSDLLKKFLKGIVESLTSIKGVAFRLTFLAFVFFIMFLPMTIQFSALKPVDKIFRVMNTETAAKFDNSFKILFCGDLILLEDQVKRGFDGNTYNFAEVFEYATPYISRADLSIGVFEGPLGGTGKNFSQSNFDDGKELYLNFPDEFADAVKNAGFDLVTTANNHLLDMGIDGAFRTIKILNDKQIDFIGSYSGLEEKKNHRVKILERDGIKIAVLAYTYGTNNHDTDEFINANSFISSFIVGEDSPNFKKVVESVKEDFILAKSFSPDLIIVLPHWGTQFSDAPDKFQQTWQKIFIDCGADIIFGDHTHSVQPIEYDGKNFTLFCPGNFANIYREHNGDASALVEVYIDRATKKIIGGAIIPLWTESTLDGNYRALPTNEIFTNKKLRGELSTRDFERVEEVLRHVTKIMLGEEINFNQSKYFFDEGDFMRKKVASLEISNEMRGDFYKALTAAQNVCFIGDSLTEGTKNGGVAYFEPVEHLIRGKIFNISQGGATTKILLEHLNEITKTDADLFVIALGANDVRYRDEKICSMTPEEYVFNLKKIRDAVKNKNSAAKFIFIAPWTSTDGDFISAVPFNEKIKLNDAYSAALKDFCAANGEIFINANPHIESVLKIYPQKDYLVDFIHPNAEKGVTLYAAAVLLAK